MAQAIINRPVCEKNFTITPNVLFKPATIGLNRKTRWFISVPERFLDRQPQAVVLTPEPKNPEQGNPEQGFQGCFIKNKSTEITQKTTNEPVVVSFEVEKEIAVDLPAAINVAPVKKELSLLSKAQQVFALSVWVNTMSKGVVRNPIALAIDFARKAKDGTLSAPVDKAVDKVVDKKAKDALKNQQLAAIVKRNKSAILKELDAKYCVLIKGFGNFTRDDLRKFLEV